MTERQVVRKGAPGSVYVGRPTFLGNPYVIGVDGDREKVIAKYRSWFAQQVQDPAFADHVRVYCQEFDLACWCAPLPCHADVIAEWLEGSRNEPERRPHAVVVYHASYDCGTGCCGHRIKVGDSEQFRFSHPHHGEDYRSFAERLVRDEFGAEHVNDLDWENCLVIDD